MNDEIKFSEASKVAIAGPDIVNILEGLAADADADLSTAVSIESTRVFPSVADLPLEKNQDGKYIWKEITDVSVVATDLKSSTAVSYGKQDRVGARLYQASTGNCAKVLQPFGPDFVDIQGDGLFAIFAGDKHNERAICAAISLNTFGHRLRKMLAAQAGEAVPAMKDSGLRIGADRGLLLAKKIGIRGEHNEPVWTGKPVNYATKCAQAADAGQLVVTARFFRDLRESQYVRWSCGHVGGELGDIGPLWRKITVESLGQDQDARELGAPWCEHCGTKFCRAILRGDTDRGLNTGQLPKWKPDPEKAEGQAAAA